MNILLTSAGRRTSLLRAFQEAARRWEGKVFAADLDPLAPTSHLADGTFRLPPVLDESYLPALHQYVREHGIDLVVPTIDTELPMLAGAAAEFRASGCQLLISSPSFIRIAEDKKLTAQTFSRSSFKVIPTWLPDCLPDTLPDHLFVKPRRGSASQNAFSVHRRKLHHALALLENPVIQPVIEQDEITVDALFDFEGKLLHYVPRLRIRTLAGESIQGMTIPPERLHAWLLDLLQLAGDLGARGPLTLQAFLTETTPLLSEINPRFGGGFPLTQAAGGHYPLWILQMMHGEKPATTLGQYRVGLYMTRYHSELFTDQPDAGRPDTDA